jgi:hypothetical protein
MSLLLLLRSSGAGVPAVVPVGIVDPVVSIGRGGLFRRTLVNQSFSAGCWPLSGLYKTDAMDISGNENHGAYSGTGFTRGIPLLLPEGGLGLTFDGNGWINVPDDGPEGNRTLSLANGDADVCTLLKTTTNDATLRCIVCKQMTDSNGDGYYLGMQNGAIVWFVKIAAFTFINMVRGAIADGEWHDIHAIFDTVAHEAWITIDGVQSGFKASGLSAIEPAYQPVDLRIGKFTDGAGGFIGSLAYVMVGREGNQTLGAELHACRQWTVLGDVKQSPGIATRQGIQGSGITDLVAEPGSMTLELNNSERNSAQTLGLYTPDHTDALAGWQEGIPIKVEQVFNSVTYPLFIGRIDHIDIRPGVKGPRSVLVTCSDYMAALQKALLPPVEAMTEVRSDDVIRRIIEECDTQPHAITFGMGSETFPFALDVAANPSLLTECQRVCLSEQGRLYVLSDGTLVFEGRSQRQTDITFDTTLVNTMNELAVERSRDSIVNQLQVTAYPRRVDTLSDTVLYTLPADVSPITIQPGDTQRIRVDYSDPTQEGSPVGAVDVQTPTFTLLDPAGADRSAEAVVAFVGDPGGTNADIDITNNTSVPLNLTAFELTGRAVYRSAPVTLPAFMDADSIRQWGPQPRTLDLTLTGDVNLADAIGRQIIASRSRPQTRATAVGFPGNRDASRMVDALSRQPGDRIGLTETVSGLVSTTGLHIQGVERLIGPASLRVARWTLGPAPSDDLPTLWQLGVAGYGELGDTTYLGL